MLFFGQRSNLQARDLHGQTQASGLFVASDGRQINADINGAANILRKVFPNAFADGIQGVVVRPVRLTPYKVAA